MQVTTPDFIPQPFASEGVAATIPDSKEVFGQASWSEGFPDETGLPLNAGGIPPRRQDFNGTLKALSQHTFFGQSGCLYPWSATLNYLKNSHVVGSDGMEYAAKLASGPDVSGVGAQNPTLDTDGTYWANVSDVIGTGSGGGGGIPEPATATPKKPGTAAVGTSLKYAREDHVHPVGTVAQKATRSTSGSWSITGLKVGVPLFIIGSTDNGGFGSIRVTSGTNDIIDNMSALIFGYNAPQAGDDYSTNVVVVIPTSTTVEASVTVDAGSLTFRAYQ